MIKKGDKVKLYPHGSPEQAVEAEVTLIGKKQFTSIVLSLDTLPEFVQGVMNPPSGDIIFLGMSFGAGPWVELFGGGHYEIEEIQ